MSAGAEDFDQFAIAVEQPAVGVLDDDFMSSHGHTARSAR
jgi:hypothetical protein